MPSIPPLQLACSSVKPDDATKPAVLGGSPDSLGSPVQHLERKPNPLTPPELIVGVGAIPSPKIPPVTVEDPRARWEASHPIEAFFHQMRMQSLADAPLPRVVVQLEMMHDGLGDIAFGKKLKAKLEALLPQGSHLVFVGSSDVIEAAEKFGYTVEYIDPTHQDQANIDVLIMAPLVGSKPKLQANHVLHMVEYNSRPLYHGCERSTKSQVLFLGVGSKYSGCFLDVPEMSQEQADAITSKKLSHHADPGLCERLRKSNTQISMVYAGKARWNALKILIGIAQSKPVVAIVQNKNGQCANIPKEWKAIVHADGLNEELCQMHPDHVHVVYGTSMSHEEMVACLKSSDIVFCTGDHTPIETLMCNPDAVWIHEAPVHKVTFVIDTAKFAETHGYQMVNDVLRHGSNAMYGYENSVKKIVEAYHKPELRKQWSEFSKAMILECDVTLPLEHAVAVSRTHAKDPQWRFVEDLLLWAQKKRSYLWMLP